MQSKTTKESSQEIRENAGRVQSLSWAVNVRTHPAPPFGEIPDLGWR